MTKEECLGKIVMLDEGFLLDAYDFDNGVPPKTKRPYLVVELEKVALEKKDDEKQLFAIPMQTSVGYKDLDNSRFYTRLPRRLTAKMNCETALIYSQMIPITIEQIDSLKESEDMVPYKFDEKQAVLYNLKTMDSERVPEKVRQDFISMKKLAYAKFDIFQNKFFREKYSKVADGIFQEAIRVKDKMYDNILKKAQNYLSTYEAFRKQLENKRKYGDYQGKRIRLPRYYVKLDKMYNFVDEYNSSVKTSLQSDKKKETKELTPKQIEIAKNLSDRTGKPVDRVTKVFEYIHNNGIFAPKEPVASKQKVIVKTQEKNNNQQPASVKPKKKDSDYNCR